MNHLETNLTTLFTTTNFGTTKEAQAHAWMLVIQAALYGSYYDDSTLRLGIGTTSPRGNLEVDGYTLLDGYCHISGALTVNDNLTVQTNATVDGLLTAAKLTLTNASLVVADTSTTSSNNSAVDVVFSNQEIDTLGEYNPATGIFTAQSAGVYVASWTVLTTNSAWIAQNQCYTQLSRNNAVTTGNGWIGTYNVIQTNGTYYVSSNGSAIVQLAAGNTLRLKYFANRTAGATALDGEAQPNFLHIARIQ